MIPAVIYLHGFASSPNSKKAKIFSAGFAALGVRLEVPELAPAGLEDLTLTNQMQVISDLAARRPAALIGSSLGGYLAALYAARHASVRKVVLLAPAFGFARLYLDSLGEERGSAWRETGRMEVMNYATGAPAGLGWQLMEDAMRYEDEPAVAQPCLIYHGIHDDVVPIEVSRAFARTHDAVELREMDSGHELMNVVEEVFEGAREFLI